MLLLPPENGTYVTLAASRQKKVQSGSNLTPYINKTCSSTIAPLSVPCPSHKIFELLNINTYYSILQDFVFQ